MSETVTDPVLQQTSYMRRQGEALLAARIERLGVIYAEDGPMLLLVEETLSIVAALRMINPRVVADCEYREQLAAFKAAHGICVGCENKPVKNNLCAACGAQ